ncbi:MAG TPA: arginine--tRNA ligase [Thermotogota bacterium]|nr:arginine--tRNA ligase [Thermotogota bacterium]HRW91761.1 arginine--tRNA ligase [Thermotogota bacterium]
MHGLMSPKDVLYRGIAASLKELGLDPDALAFHVETPPRPEMGDFSSNVAMVGARQAKKAPRALGEAMLPLLHALPEVERVCIEGPGFLNFVLSDAFYHEQLEVILHAQELVPEPMPERRQKIQLEFVSANPTGPLTVGHGRQAVIGDVLASVYQRLGFDVTREYYFNDAGKQMQLLARSVWVRYQELFGHEHPIPEGGYHGEYITEIARNIQQSHAQQFVGEDTPEVLAFFLETAKNALLSSIQKTLEAMSIRFDVFFSERSLFEDGTVSLVQELLAKKDLVYQKEGATWFRASAMGDGEDKVLIRSDGGPTYFFTDIANHYKKYQRGFEKVYDIWGADHHGHISRMEAAMKALEVPEGFFNVILHQMVSLKQGGEIMKMSTRAGNFVTLDELIAWVGQDATRYFFAMIDKDTHFTFDIDLAQSRSMDNPVYYLQYAHARICSLFEKASEKFPEFQLASGLSHLTGQEDRQMIRMIALYPSVLEEVVQNNAVHRLTNYLFELASRFHHYYNHFPFIDPSQSEVSSGRLSLAWATRKIIRDGLGLLGVSCPETM